jgi:hypothetical protein
LQNYQIKITEKLYNECWDELYYTNLVDHIEDYTKQNYPLDFNLQQLDSFFENNISYKKIGRSSQVIFQINNIAEIYILEMILWQTEHWAKIHYKEGDQASAPYSKSVHKNHLEILNKKYEEVRTIKNEYQGKE